MGSVVRLTSEPVLPDERELVVQERPSPRRLRDHCGLKPGSTSGFPFGEEHRVFKVCGKVFAVLHVEESPVKITFKADPELTGLLRGQYPSIRPARSRRPGGTGPAAPQRRVAPVCARWIASDTTPGRPGVRAAERQRLPCRRVDSCGC